MYVSLLQHVSTLTGHLQGKIRLFIRHRNFIISSTNFNAHFNINMYVTLLSSTCFGP